jgi:sugar lactone lactonase YvrE
MTKRAAVPIEPFLRQRLVLGECPLWDQATGRLWWTDIFGCRLHRSDATGAGPEAFPLPLRVNSFALRADGRGLVAGCWTGFAFLDPDAGTAKRLSHLPAEQPGFVLNDGRCDRARNFWAGTVCETYDMPGAALFRLAPDGTRQRMADGLLASNGVAFAPDGRTLYYACSVVGVVWAFDLDPDDGVLTRRRVFARLHRPDGATVDSDGCYWVASFAAGEVLRFTPDGREDRRVRLPVTQVSACAFGGAALDTLFVTTGTFRLTEAEAAAQPLAGSVFAVTGLGATGLPEPRFGP